MKVFSKPISSPGRTEKYPPPLMRFLRSNGSRSRGRSRSSPMFLRKKNNTVIETQEPSSPKVTCIGQVRVRRSSKSSSNSSRRKSPARNRHCWCVPKTQFFHQFAHTLKPRSFNQVWHKCVSFFRFGYCKKVETRDDTSKMDSNQSGKHRETDTEDEESEVKVSDDVDFVSYSPPKNALILTRCRSAPYSYRSSSLANLFWGSRLSTNETGGDEIEKQKALQQQEERPTSDSDHNCKDSTVVESRLDRDSEENLGISQELEGSINGRTEETNVFESSAQPLTLTRCKSEPARTGSLEREALLAAVHHVCDAHGVD